MVKSGQKHEIYVNDVFLDEEGDYQPLAVVPDNSLSGCEGLTFGRLEVEKLTLKSTGEIVIPTGTTPKTTNLYLSKYGSKKGKVIPRVFNDMRIPVGKPMLAGYKHYLLTGNNSIQLVHEDKIKVER